MFTKIIKYPEHKRPNIYLIECKGSGKRGDICGSKVLDVRDDIQRISREVGLGIKEGYFFIFTKGKTE